MCAFDFFPFTCCYGENGCCGSAKDFAEADSESAGGDGEGKKTKKKKKSKKADDDDKPTFHKDNTAGENLSAMWEGGKSVLRNTAGAIEDGLGGSDAEEK